MQLQYYKTSAGHIKPSPFADLADIDECVLSLHNCSDLEVCLDTEGAFECLCLDGYIRDMEGNCTGKTT